MSKLFDIYTNLKNKDSNTLYLFKSGIFYIFLDKDAKIAAELFHLKITYLNENIIKCGFPVQSLEKYISLFKKFPYNFKIIDTTSNKIFPITDYLIHEDLLKLLVNISSVNTDNLSIREAYALLEEFKNIAKIILKEEKFDEKQ